MAATAHTKQPGVDVTVVVTAAAAACGGTMTRVEQIRAAAVRGSVACAKHTDRLAKAALHRPARVLAKALRLQWRRQKAASITRQLCAAHIVAHPLSHTHHDHHLLLRHHHHLRLPGADKHRRLLHVYGLALREESAAWARARWGGRAASACDECPRTEPRTMTGWPV